MSTESAKEIATKHNIDPLEEMVKMYKCEIPCPEDPAIYEPLLDRYDVIVKDDGKKWLTLKVEMRFNVIKELAQYIYPKLRASENNNTNDTSIKITIKQISSGAEDMKILDLPKARAAIEFSDG